MSLYSIIYSKDKKDLSIFSDLTQKTKDTSNFTHFNEQIKFKSSLFKGNGMNNTSIFSKNITTNQDKLSINLPSQDFSNNNQKIILPTEKEEFTRTKSMKRRSTCKYENLKVNGSKNIIKDDIKNVNFSKARSSKKFFTNKNLSCSMIKFKTALIKDKEKSSKILNKKSKKLDFKCTDLVKYEEPNKNDKNKIKKRKFKNMKFKSLNTDTANNIQNINNPLNTLNTISNIYDYNSTNSNSISKGIFSSSRNYILSNNLYPSKSMHNGQELNKRQANTSINFYDANNKLKLYKNYLKTSYMLRHPLLHYEQTLCDILINDNIYKNLCYKENKIFGYSSRYDELMIESIKRLAAGSTISDIDKPKSLVKYYPKSQFLNCKLNFNSITLEFINQNKPSSKFIYGIPFEYIPLFYYDNMKHLKELLMSLFTFDEQFEKVNLKENEIKNILNNSKIYYFGEEGSYYSSVDEDEINTVHIYSNDCDKLHEKLEINYDNTYKQFFNEYEFIWVTPIYHYKVIVKIPEVQLSFGDYIIKKYVDIELVLFLLENNLCNWDFFLIEYLFSYKSFRWIIKKNLSKLAFNNLMDEYDKQKINKTKYGYLKFTNLSVDTTSELNKNLNNKNKIIINLEKEKRYCLTFKSTHFSFIYTNNNQENCIKTLHNYKVRASNNEVNKTKEFLFHFSLNEMIKLNALSKRQSLKFIIEKLIIYRTSELKIDFNYEFLDRFQVEDAVYIEEFKPDDDTYQITAFKRTGNGSQITINFPTVETTIYKIDLINEYRNCFFQKFEGDDQTLGIALVLLNRICSSDMNEWPYLIIKDKEEKFKRAQNKRETKKQRTTRKKLSGFIDEKNLIRLERYTLKRQHQIEFHKGSFSSKKKSKSSAKNNKQLSLPKSAGI